MADFQKLKQELSEKRLLDNQLSEMLQEKELILKEEIEKLQANFLEANAELINDCERVKTELSETDAALRSAMIEHFLHTGEKSIDSDLTVRVNTRLLYDKNEALNWAKEHNLALKLDEREFEKIASSTDISFVVIEEKPIAAISKKL